MTCRLPISILVFSLLAGVSVQAEDEAALREKASKLQKQGNHKDAYEVFSKLSLDANTDKLKVGDDLKSSAQCLASLGRDDELDEFREKVVSAHSGNWRLLHAAAQTLNSNQHYGFIVAGKFSRGRHRGGDGRYVNSIERDRIRALQLLNQALEKGANEPDKAAISQLCTDYAEMLLSNKGYRAAWRLQDLSDLMQLPDYDDGYSHNSSQRGAPVDEQGNPIFYSTPKSFKEARSDGERWRWLMMQASELNPARTNQLRFQFAQFLQQQFDVATMAAFGRGSQSDDDDKNESGPFAVKSLGEDETIAKLATGVKRFKLPDEFNFIKIFQQIASEKSEWGEKSLGALAATFTNRQQYKKAAEVWRRNIAEYGDPTRDNKKTQLQQIVGNWGIFEPASAQTPANAATLDYRFRNGTAVHFEAYELNVAKLLDDTREYLSTQPNRLDWQKIDIHNVGYRVIERNEAQYRGALAAQWDEQLKPRDNHFDRRVTIGTPLKKAGAYLVSAQMKDGNASHIVVWISDTVILKKPMNNQIYCFVADAQTGAPVPDAKLDFFGYRMEYKNNGQQELLTKRFEAKSGVDGQLITNQLPQNYQWVITASTAEGRFAYLGFSHVWYNNYHEQTFDETKIFGITDRPVYRPNQPVKFKFWVGQAKYDQEGPSKFANQQFNLKINDPKGEKIFEKQFTSDEFGGFDGEFTLDKQATLGSYYIFLDRYGQGVSFRLEEYKKPEFEVKVDAPSDPVMLGEKIASTITAKYYFGAPVVSAKVKYKILRHDHSANWYPTGAWDWFYEPGYWWFAGDYPWYPGWREWGCKRPHYWWWGSRHTPPEVIVENEVAIGADGTVKVEIDTAIAKQMRSDTDHKYEITAEITDQSRRTITGSGNVLVARKPFKVYAWLDRGHYKAGDAIQANFSAQTLDNKPVQGKGNLKLLRISYDADGKASEKVAQEWPLDTDSAGKARHQIKASEPGQYRVSYSVSDAKNHTMEGGYVFVVRGEGFDSSKFRFNDLELVPDAREYKPGDTVAMLANTNQANSTVLLFVRPSNGVYLAPKILKLNGKSVIEPIEVEKKDMPNFFVEAVTVSGGRLVSEMREIVVPPEKRVVNVEVVPSAVEFKPGEKAKVKLKLTDQTGEPVRGSTAISIYDKSVEYISGGSNVQEIKSFFWKWRRHHYPGTESSLKASGNLSKSKEPAMTFLGVFGALVADDELAELRKQGGKQLQTRRGGGAKTAGIGGAPGGKADTLSGMAEGGGALSFDGALAQGKAKAPAATRNALEAKESEKSSADKLGEAGGEDAPPAEAAIRSNFADTAFWAAAINTDERGIAEFSLTMPESLTSWKIKAWTMSQGTRVGQGDVEVLTKKNVIVRLQAPRFFTQKDEVVISANVHNYLKTKKKVTVVLETEGSYFNPVIAKQDGASQDGFFKRVIEVEPNGEQRVDWRLAVVAEGEPKIRVKALTNEESDAMEMKFPAYVHGMLKTESFSGNIRPDKDSGKITFNIPAERRANQTNIEVRYSPTLAGAMVDALPYLSDYPYGCTEQTLSRFLPTVITQKVLRHMNVDLRDVQQKITNFNAQQIGNDVERMQQWKRGNRNPVWDEAEVANMAKAGIDRLAAMQCNDGGWGWFSGSGEYSSPHTTAYVVHGLQIASASGLAVPPVLLDRGRQWLENYQKEQLRRMKLEPGKDHYKQLADNIDAFVCMVLTGAKIRNNEMNELIYRDRNNLAVYSKAMFGLAMQKMNDAEKVKMLIQNIEQFLVQDDENQTAYLKLPDGNHWWYWYGSEYEAQAYYLKLLAATAPKSEKASRLAKYLINNRSHGTYWNSTRDTAVCVEALAEFLTASGEDEPNMQLEIALDGKTMKTVEIKNANLFSFDNKLVLNGADIPAGAHTLEFKKKGTGPVYFNAYVTNFTLEDHIAKAGLEVKVDRKFYKLKRVDKQIKVEGNRGQSVGQKVEKYEREELKNLSTLKSGDLVEVELEIDSKNDYEYIIFEDMKAAGFEPVEVRSGYNGNDLRAYVEFRDERVCFFARTLARGKHSVSYRLRAEIPGQFSALPTRVSAMYAPELKGNSDEIKLRVED